MHQIIAGIFAALLAATPIQMVTPQQGQMTVAEELSKLEQRNWIGLTNDQMLQDLEYLYHSLDNNYPYFDVGKRMGGIGLRESYPKAVALVQACGNDLDFFLILNSWLSQSAVEAGHLTLFTPKFYDMVAPVYSDYATGSAYDLAYNNNKTKESYQKLGALINPIFDRVNEYYGYDEEAENNKPNVETKIIEQGKIAYANIRSFDMEKYEQSKDVLLDFYKQIADYDNLIIDLTENSGGGSAYFDQLIVAPNIDKPIQWTYYSLYKNGALNQKFLDVDSWVTNGYARPVSLFPQLAKFNRSDLEDLDYFLHEQATIGPATPGSKVFEGKVWMLVSGNVYSSSEWAAIGAKSTGFATLVGTQTGGDGLGTDPIPVVLPNSGLIVRYSPIYGVTEEGVGSEEFGTTPDIVSPEGETPLETCLKAIRAQK